NTCTFGVDSGDVRAENIVLKPLSCEFDLVCGDERTAVVLPVPGRHNVHNAAAAAALALAAGLSLNDVADGLQGFSNIKGRLNVKAG
ncbi:Mur ligase family protein, partial [Staphylococcus aureus]|nr:Mur ligase family protein [Staphylococcus aureus]